MKHLDRRNKLFVHEYVRRINRKNQEKIHDKSLNANKVNIFVEL